MIIFFDIDGTLISEPRGRLSQSTIKAIQAAREKGHICMINTGRSLALVGENILGDVTFDGILLGCGTMIVYRGETRMHQTFSKQEAGDIIEGLRRHGIDAVLEGSEINYRDSEERIVTEVFRKYIHQFDDLHYGSFEEAPGHFDKFYCYVDRPEKMTEFRREFGDRLDFVDRKKGYFEVTPKGFSKASGMRYIAQDLGISMTETVAIGDSSNDIPMLTCAGIGIAMGNSTEDVIRVADYVTSSIDEDGIWNALMWLGILEPSEE